MKAGNLHFLLIPLLGFSLNAGTVDVSAAQSVSVQHGGTLMFDILTSSYTANAQSFGLSQLYPSDVYFSLATASNTTGQFSATLASSGASTSLVLDSLGFIPGSLSSAGFQGAISVLQAHFHLNSALSQEIFGNGSAQLNLENTGGDLFLGLPSQTLRQDLWVTLSGGPLSAGARVTGVTLDNPIQFAAAPFGFQLGGTPTPEPGSAMMLIGGGALLFAVSTRLKRRLSRRQ